MSSIQILGPPVTPTGLLVEMNVKASLNTLYNTLQGCFGVVVWRESNSAVEFSNAK